jgi:hypothetical protein
LIVSSADRTSIGFTRRSGTGRAGYRLHEENGFALFLNAERGKRQYLKNGYITFSFSKGYFREER